MRENVAYQPRVEKLPVLAPKEESANDPIYGKKEGSLPEVTETIIADDEFAKTSPQLTPEDFREEVIMARKLTGSAHTLPNEPVIADEVLAKPVIFENESKPRLTREDFTEEAIQKARERQGIKSQLKLGSEYPEHWKVERALRVDESNEQKNTEISFPPVEPKDPTPLATRKLTRSDFPGTGSESMPALHFAEEEKIVAEKKSFLKRFVPNFVSKYFSR